MLSLISALKQTATQSALGLRSALSSRSSSLAELLQINLIHQRYLRAGGTAGPLGFPTSEVRFDAGASFREYRGGDIRILGTAISAIARQEVTITFLGFKCVKESSSDQLSPSDEPYFVITVDSGTGTPTVRKFGRFENVNTDSEIGVGEILLKGVAPNIMGLRVLAYENDFGDPDDTAKKIQETVVALSQQAQSLTSGAAAADGPGVGPAAAAGTVGAIAAGPIGALIASGVVSTLDLRDDFVGQAASILFSRSEDVGTPPKKGEFQTNEFNHQISINGGRQGEYEFFFDVLVQRIEPPRTEQDT
jgi:hypothetical protein